MTFLMNWLLYIVVIPVAAVILLIWQVVWARDKEREKEKEREELVKAIRAELKEVRDDILEEIRSQSVNR